MQSLVQIWAIIVKCGEVLPNYKLQTRIFWQFLIAFIIIVAVKGNIQVSELILLPTINWIWLIILTFVVTIFGYGLLFISVNKIDAVKTSVIELLIHNTL